MSEERRPVHPQEPAEGAEEDVESPGAEKPGDPSNTLSTCQPSTSGGPL